MVYRDNNYNNKQHGQRNGKSSSFNGKDRKNDDIKTYPEIKRCLSEEYSDPRELYLPGGKADLFAQDFKKISSSQLRKILDEIKKIKHSIKDDELTKEIKNKLYVLVPMTAYNAARNSEKTVQNLYGFIKTHITETTIKTGKDIEVFDSLFTSIVAYHKTYNKK